MSAGNLILNWLFFRWVFTALLLHGVICIAAIVMILFTPLVAMKFLDDIETAKVFADTAEVITVPLGNRTAEGWDRETGKYLYFLELPGTVILQGQRESITRLVPYLRSKPVSGRDTLEIYRHPMLGQWDSGPPIILEVPPDRKWQSVFALIMGESLTKAVVILLLKLLMMLSTIYAAIRIYFLIKGGRRGRRHRRR